MRRSTYIQKSGIICVTMLVAVGAALALSLIEPNIALPVLLIPFGLAILTHTTLVKPEWTLIIIMYSLLLGDWRTPLLGRTLILTMSEPMLYWASFVSITASLRNNLPLKKKPKRITNFDMMWVFYLTAGFLSMIIAADLLKWAAGARLTLQFVLVFYFVVSRINSMRQIRHFIYAMLIWGGVLSAEIIATVFSRGIDAGLTIIRNKIDIVVPLGASNYLATFLALPITIGVCLVWEFKGRANRKHRFALEIVVGLMVFALIITSSIGAWIALASILAIMLGLYLIVLRRISSKALLLTVLTLGVAGFIGWHLVLPRLNDIWFGRNLWSAKPVQDRLLVWTSGLRAWSQSPIFGLGYFNELIPAWYSVYGYTRMKVAEVHNWILQVGAETGILGLMGYVGLIFLGYRDLIFACKNTTHRQVKAFALALVFGISVSLLHGLIEINLLSPAFGTLFWSLIGIGVVLRRLAAQERSLPNLRRGTLEYQV